jgi:hypothetical protein
MEAGQRNTSFRRLGLRAAARAELRKLRSFARREDFVRVLSAAVLVIVPRSPVSITSTIHEHEHELGCGQQPALGYQVGISLRDAQIPDTSFPQSLKPAPAKAWDGNPWLS